MLNKAPKPILHPIVSRTHGGGGQYNRSLLMAQRALEDHLLLGDMCGHCPGKQTSGSGCMQIVNSAEFGRTYI